MMVESQKIAHIGKHQNTCHEEEYIAQKHYPAQTTDGEIAAFITQQHLHGGKTKGANAINIGCPAPCQQ